MFGPKFEAFLFAHILDLDRVEGSDFKCDNSFSKLHPKNTQIRHRWSQVQKKKLLAETLYFDSFVCGDLKYSNGFQN